jgi:hypothetical protein
MTTTTKNATSFNPAQLVARYADEFDELIADGYGVNEAVFMLLARREGEAHS